MQRSYSRQHRVIFAAASGLTVSNIAKVHEQKQQLSIRRTSAPTKALKKPNIYTEVYHHIATVTTLRKSQFILLVNYLIDRKTCAVRPFYKWNVFTLVLNIEHWFRNTEIYSNNTFYLERTITTHDML